MRMSDIMNTRKLGRLAIVIAIGTFPAACQELDITNPNQPDRDRALTDPTSVEALLSSSWRLVWNRSHNGVTVALPIPTMANEMTATYPNNANLELSGEPRRTFDNSSESDSHTVARLTWTDFNSMLASANDVLRAIERGLVIRTNDGTGLRDNTERARTFATFMQGLGQAQLGVSFDRAHIADQHTDLERLPPYSEYPVVLAAGIQKLEEAIGLMEANEFTLPDTWITGVTITNDQLAQIAHSYIARILVYSARTPAERAAVDWDRVLFHIERGITEDHGPIANATVFSNYLQRAQHATTLQQRADYRLVGPADISGNYQEWLQTPVESRNRFDITTPDRRITGAAGPTSDGSYFRYMPTNVGFDQTRGTYRLSAYQWFRLNGRFNAGFVPIMSVDEMRLLAAEAHYHRGRHDVAAELINVTRVANGQLPPVTADGVTEDDACVPRTDEGACGSLMDALHYERMIELAGLDASRAYLDKRGFGTLSPGTLLHFPVPATELLGLNLPIYTFGGVGGSWSAE